LLISQLFHATAGPVALFISVGQSRGVQTRFNNRNQPRNERAWSMTPRSLSAGMVKSASLFGNDSSHLCDRGALKKLNEREANI